MKYGRHGSFLITFGLLACSAVDSSTPTDGLAPPQESKNPKPITSTKSDSLTGNVAFLRGEQADLKKVTLPAFQGGLFRNNLVHFIDLPEGLAPDATGCFCYPSTDDRFAYVHTYYHAIQALEVYNQQLLSLNLPTVSNIAIRITKADPGYPTVGTVAGESEVVITTSSPVVDLSVLVHELGHTYQKVLHRAISDADTNEALAYGTKNLLAFEAIANIFSALYLESSWLGEYAWRDGKIALADRNTYATILKEPLHFPERIASEADVISFWASQPYYSKTYSEWVSALQKNVDIEPKIHQSPDFYANTPLLGEPLLAEAKLSGYPTMRRVFLRALHQTPNTVRMTALAARIVEEAQREEPKQPGITKRLKQGYALTGLLPANADLFSPLRSVVVFTL